MALVTAVDRNTRQALRIESLSLCARIAGAVAQCDLWLRVWPPDARAPPAAAGGAPGGSAPPHNVEAEVLLVLPSGAAVCAFQTDVYGQMVDGVVVPKKDAQVAFENATRATVEGRIATCEHLQGNQFRVRIFPVPRKTGRSVKSSAYSLDFSFADTIQTVSCSVRVSGARGDERPVVVSGGDLLAGCCFAPVGYTARGGDWEARLDRSGGVRVSSGFVVETALPHAFHCVAMGGFPSFLLTDVAPSQPAHLGKAKKAGQWNVEILWDASGSRSRAAAELSAVREIIRLCGEAQVGLTTFRESPDPRRTFTATKGRCAELIDALQGTRYDGATNLEAVVPLVQRAGVDFCLLFSDGIGNLGSHDPLPKGARAPVHCFTANSKADFSTLKKWSVHTGGSFYDLKSQDDFAAVVEPPFSLLRIEHGDDVLDMFPRSGQRSVPKIWAMMKIEDSLLTDADKEGIVEVGKAHGIVTPATSMIVLDSLEQYLLYKIEPPATLPFHKQYLSEVKRLRDTSEEKEHARVRMLQTAWKRRMEWYDYPRYQAGVWQPNVWHHLPVGHPADRDAVIEFNPNKRSRAVMCEEAYKKMRQVIPELELTRPLLVDLRVVLVWDTDVVDLDLVVIDV
eukprot:m51a1_g2675 hypothetical protein (623) ;mRNA; f:724952-728853